MQKTVTRKHCFSIEHELLEIFSIHFLLANSSKTSEPLVCLSNFFLWFLIDVKYLCLQFCSQLFFIVAGNFEGLLCNTCLCSVSRQLLALQFVSLLYSFIFCPYQSIALQTWVISPLKSFWYYTFGPLKWSWVWGSFQVTYSISDNRGKILWLLKDCV